MLRALTLLVVATTLAAAQQPIGGNRCTWGPSYWCATVDKANECNALSACQSMGKLLDAKPVLGANKCTWGPAYSCASMENANECKMLEACQRMGMLPGGTSGDVKDSRRSLNSPLVGANKCTWGPAYFCASVNNANECKTLEACQSMGLLTGSKSGDIKDSRRSVGEAEGPLVGTTKCSWGPSYWCASVDNANECHALTHCQSLGLLADTPAPAAASADASADASSNTNTNTGSQNSPHLLGANKCMWGPSYWCSSLENANECKMLEHCQRLGLLKNADASATAEPLVGSTKCTQGPAYWCASVDNANECKMLEHCQSLNLLPKNTAAASGEQQQQQQQQAQPWQNVNRCLQGPVFWCASEDNAKECDKLAECQRIGLLRLDEQNKGPAGPLGSSNCAQGPVYWCASVANANECGMLARCQEMKLLVDTNAQPQAGVAGAESIVRRDTDTPVGSNKCTWGPSYWCTSVDNANECQMLEQCQRMGLLPATNANAKTNTNANTNANQPHLLGANKCVRGPAYWCASVDNANECKMLSHCQSLGLLGGTPTMSQTNPSRALGSSKCTMGPTYWCSSVDNAKECHMLQHCQQMKLLPSDEVLQQQADEDETVSRRSLPKNKLAHSLPQAGSCAQGLSYWCASAANANECNRLLLCKRVGLLLGAPMANPTQADLKGLECDVCEEVIKLVDEVLATNSTETELLQGLLDLCNDLPSSVQSECSYFVNQYGPEVIQFLITSLLNPQSVCTEIGACSANGAVFNKERLVAAVKAVIAKRMPANKVKDTECDICKDVLGALQSALQDPNTQQDILTEVELICDEAGPLKNTCMSFIKQYGPEVLNFLASEIDPLAFCTDIGLCSQRMLNGVPFPPSN